VIKLYQWQRAERSEKTGVWGSIPQEVRVEYVFRSYHNKIIGLTSGAVIKLYQWQRAERSEKTGVWGRIPQEVLVEYV
jgi:hypothetical protein